MASVNVQLHATRQVKMYSYGVAFGLTYGLLPTNATNAQLFDKTASEFTLRFGKIQKQRFDLIVLCILYSFVLQKSSEDSQNHLRGYGFGKGKYCVARTNCAGVVSAIRFYGIIVRKFNVNLL